MHKMVVGSALLFEDGATIKKGDRLSVWNPTVIPILSEKTGVISFTDMILGVTVKREKDDASGRIASTVIEHKEDLNPQIVIRNDKGEPVASYSVPTGAQISVNEGDFIEKGHSARTPEAARSDITGGLPRVC